MPMRMVPPSTDEMLYFEMARSSPRNPSATQIILDGVHPTVRDLSTAYRRSEERRVGKECPV